MTDRSSEQALLDRANLDAKIAFVAASFLLAYAFAALLDRVGAPERFVGGAPPYFTVLGLATLGFLLHSMRVSVYYTAGRALPAAYAGFANAAIVVALMLPFGARLAGRSWSTGAIAGVFIGLAVAGLYLGPLLRKTGVFSISELLSARFQSAAARVGFIGAVALSSTLLAAAGGLIAVNALVDLTGANRGFAAFLVAATSLIIAGPGGLSGVMWASAAAAGVATLGFGWPVAALSVRDALPAGLIFGGEASTEAANLLANWKITPAQLGVPVELATTLAAALGLATLAPVLASSLTTADKRSARRAGVAALFWTIVIALLALGYGRELLVLWFLPWMIGQVVMLTFFTWTPHHDHHETGRYRNTRVSLFPFANFLLQGQNYHLIHHMMPAIPYYRYKAVFDELRPVLEKHDVRIEGFFVDPRNEHPAAG